MTFQPGDPVVYRAGHPGAAAEDGEVVRVGRTGIVFVLYRGDLTPKATDPDDLELVR